MLIYDGYGQYTFHKPRGGTIELTKEDIETIVDFAEASNEFRAGEKLEALKESSLHWRELHEELQDKHSSLIEEIKTLLNCN